MKKIIYILLTIATIITFYFYYDNNSFNNYIENSKRKENMNIPINERAPVISRNQIKIDAPVETVWKVLTNIKNWPKWQKAVTETQVLGNIEEGTQFNWKANGLSLKSKVHTSNPYTEFGWTGKTLGAYAIHNWIFIKKDNTTVVVVEESLQGVLPKLFKSYFQKNLDNGVLTNLMELKSYSEIINKQPG